VTMKRGFAVDDTHLSMTSVCGHLGNGDSVE